MARPTTVHRPPPAALMVLAAFSWALGIVMTKVTLEQLAPLDVLAAELLVGGSVVWIALLARGGPRRPAGWLSFALLGLLEPGLSYALGDFGLDRTGVADGALLLASESLFTLLLAWSALGERFGPRVGAALALGFGGSVLIGLGESGNGASVLGDALVLGGSAAAAVYAVAARRVASAGDSDPLTVTAIQLLAAAIASAPLVAGGALSGHSAVASADAAHLLAAVATGLLSTAIPFFLYNRAIRDLQVASAALVLNLIPVFGAGLAVVLLMERPGWVQIGGGAIVLIAALGAEGRDAARPPGHASA